MRAYSGRRAVATLLLNIGTRGRCVVNFTGKNPREPTENEAERAPSASPSALERRKIFVTQTGIRNPHHPVRSLATVLTELSRVLEPFKPVFLNGRAAARYRALALASIIPGRDSFSWNLSFYYSKHFS